jgi:hypothetical protein
MFICVHVNVYVNVYVNVCKREFRILARLTNTIVRNTDSVTV